MNQNVKEYDLLIKENQDLKLCLKAFENNNKLFHALVETAVGDIGQDFFNSIVRKLSEWLNAECVIIGQIVSENKVEGFPLYLDGEIIQGFSYNLQGTPCDLTSKKGFCVFPQNVIHFYPQSKDIRELNIEGYVGTALYNKEGIPNGILCAMSRKKLDLPPQAEEILRIIGSRITAEIERIKAQKALEITDQKLKEANAAKDKFFSIISHDLRNPLNTIMGFSELLLEDIENRRFSEIESYARIIVDVSNQSNNLLHNLLEWSLTQINGVSSNPEWFNIATLFNDVVNLQYQIAWQKEIKITSSFTNEFEIYADLNMIKTILRNLVSNAIKYTNPKGTINIEAAQENGLKKISVSDTGIGMKPEILDHLFSIEKNFSTTGTNNEKGTGLGLVLCKSFIEKHNGDIWA